jgi:hypothetical protein
MDDNTTLAVGDLITTEAATGPEADEIVNSHDPEHQVHHANLEVIISATSPGPLSLYDPVYIIPRPAPRAPTSNHPASSSSSSSIASSHDSPTAVDIRERFIMHYPQLFRSVRIDDFDDLLARFSSRSNATYRHVLHGHQIDNPELQHNPYKGAFPRSYFTLVMLRYGAGVEDIKDRRHFRMYHRCFRAVVEVRRITSVTMHEVTAYKGVPEDKAYEHCAYTPEQKRGMRKEAWMELWHCLRLATDGEYAEGERRLLATHYPTHPNIGTTTDGNAPPPHSDLVFPAEPPALLPSVWHFLPADTSITSYTFQIKDIPDIITAVLKVMRELRHRALADAPSFRESDMRGIFGKADREVEDGLERCGMILARDLGAMRRAKVGETEGTGQADM